MKGRRGVLVAAVLLGALALGAAIDGSSSRPASGAGVPAFDAAFAAGVRELVAGRHAEALARFDEVLREAPALPEAHVNAGFALLGLGRAARARERFLAAIDLRVGQANAYWGLAVALEALGDVEGARGAMRTFVHLAPPGIEQVRRARAALWEWETRS